MPVLSSYVFGSKVHEMEGQMRAMQALFETHVFGVHRMIHGHTHRPAVHELTVDASPVRRIVLGDWYTQGSVLFWSSDDFELRAVPR